MRFVPQLLLAAFVCAPLAGCSEDVDAILGTDRAFTLYGVLTPQADTQWVRVFPVEERLEDTRPEPLGAVVRSTDLQTGEQLVWRDTVMLAHDLGTERSYGYYYWAAFTPAYGRAYRIEVAGEGALAAVALVRVPERSELEVIPNASALATTQRVLVRGAASHFINVRVVYDIKFGLGQGTNLNLTRRYDGRKEPAEGGYQFLVDLQEDRRAAETYLRDNRLYTPSYGVELLQMTMHLVVADPSWAPPGGAFDFDPDVVVDPGVLTNVENGFGFVGAGYELQRTWLPDEATLRSAGWSLPVDTSGVHF